MPVNPHALMMRCLSHRRKEGDEGLWEDVVEWRRDALRDVWKAFNELVDDPTMTRRRLKLKLHEVIAELGKPNGGRG